MVVGEEDHALLACDGGVGAGTGGEGGADGAKAATDTHAGVPIPRPMDVEEPEWDVQGDCVPLPPWKVRRRAGVTCSRFSSPAGTRFGGTGQQRRPLADTMSIFVFGVQMLRVFTLFVES